MFSEGLFQAKRAGNQVGRSGCRKLASKLVRRLAEGARLPAYHLAQGRAAAARRSSLNLDHTPAPHLLRQSPAFGGLPMPRLAFPRRDADKLLIAAISRSRLPAISAAPWRRDVPRARSPSEPSGEAEVAKGAAGGPEEAAALGE